MHAAGESRPCADQPPGPGQVRVSVLGFRVLSFAVVIFSPCIASNARPLRGRSPPHDGLALHPCQNRGICLLKRVNRMLVLRLHIVC